MILFLLSPWKHFVRIHYHTIFILALANKTGRLIGQRQKFATVYSTIYRRKPDVISNVACDWSTCWFYILLTQLTFWGKYLVFDVLKLQSTLEWVSIFKISFGEISRDKQNFRSYIRRYTSLNGNIEYSVFQKSPPYEQWGSYKIKLENLTWISDIQWHQIISRFFENFLHNRRVGTVYILLCKLPVEIYIVCYHGYTCIKYKQLQIETGHLWCIKQVLI